MTYYFFHDGSMQHGPFTASQIQSKNLPDKTPVWYLGLKDWTTIGKISELQPIISQGESLPVRNTNAGKNKVIAIGSGVIVAMILLFWLSNNGTSNSENSVKFASASASKLNIASLAPVEKHKHYRNNWENYIRLSSNKTISDSKGLAAFDFYVTNDTDCMLDNTEIIIHYMKAGRICGTKLLSIQAIAGNSVGRSTAPASSVADSARVSIRQITSKELSFAYPRNNGTADDPYHFQ